ncbi:electron transfer flavoprotein subunit beta/FixA family protein [Herbidospora sp. RD11066]
MNIVVCVKQVPDTATERKLRSEDSTLDRSANGVINELCEYAVEDALKLKEAHGGEVTVLTMGPDQATDAIRKALAMGADKAVHLSDEALHGSDALSTSYALSQALKKIGFDVVILGSESTDARTGMLAAMLAERLGVAQLTLAEKIEVSGSSISIHRQTEYGYDKVEASLPAVVSVVEKPDPFKPRYPSFKGIMAAKKKPIEKIGIADAEIDPAQIGLAAAWSVVAEFETAPPRGKGVVVNDEGDGGTKAAEFLVSKKFI